MNKIVSLILAAVMVLGIVSPALAGGGPPPKDVLKGVFTEIDPATGAATFVKDSTHETIILSLGEDMLAEEVPVGSKVMVSLDTHAGPNVIKEVDRMFIDITLTKLLALLVVGLVGGLLSGFIGSGGAFVLTPAMMSLGAPGAVAVASNMCHKFPKAMVGTFKRWKYGQVDVKLGLIMALSAIGGVQIGVTVQKWILNTWGNAGSNLYVSVCFVVILVVVGSIVFRDAFKLSRGAARGEVQEHKISSIALALQKVKIPPMIHFEKAGVTMSFWITVPVGLATGMLAATIAVGGFIGVPGMIYIVGASALVASATELLVAFVMGAWGSVQWAVSGLVDIRLTLLILAASLFGVQLGALGTTYVKDYVIKVVMGSVMLIVAVSRGAKLPGYLADVGLSSPLSPAMAHFLDQVSFWALVAALGTAGFIIAGAMISGISRARAESRQAEAAQAYFNG